jgi:carbon monoxide dehydrogenase subunit G
METTFESRVGTIHSSDEKIYNFLGNFNNFKNFIPADKVDKFESSEDHCRFSVSGVGEIGLRIVEREPFKTIKTTGEGMANQKFFLWVQLKQNAENDTKIKLTLKADLNPMIKMMASKPLQDFLNKLVDAMEKMPV